MLPLNVKSNILALIGLICTTTPKGDWLKTLVLPLHPISSEKSKTNPDSLTY